MNKIIDGAKEILSSSEKTKEFAKVLGVDPNVMESLLENIVSEPEISQDAMKHIYSENTTSELKAYCAGEERGYKAGHSAGFWKGFRIDGICSLILGALIYASTKKDDK